MKNLFLSSGIKDCEHNLDRTKVGHINLRDSLRMQAIEYAKANKMKKAIKNFKVLTELTPKYILAWQFLAKAQAQIGKHAKVEKTQKECARRNPKKQKECYRRI